MRGDQSALGGVGRRRCERVASQGLMPGGCRSVDTLIPISMIDRVTVTKRRGRRGRHERAPAIRFTGSRAPRGDSCCAAGTALVVVVKRSPRSVGSGDIILASPAVLILPSRAQSRCQVLFDLQLRQRPGKAPLDDPSVSESRYTLGLGAATDIHGRKCDVCADLLRRLNLGEMDKVARRCGCPV